MAKFSLKKLNIFDVTYFQLALKLRALVEENLIKKLMLHYQLLRVLQSLKTRLFFITDHKKKKKTQVNIVFREPTASC